MTDDFCILCIKTGYYPYVIIGDVIVTGFTISIKKGRIIRRFGPNVALSTLAAKGPQRGTELLPASEEEEFYIANVSRKIKANKEAWSNT